MTLANVAGRPVGYAYVIDDPVGGDGACMLDDLVVAPANRMNGLGRQLVAEMARWLLEDGYTSIRGLAGGRGGTDARGGLEGWYSSMGFVFGIAGRMTANLATVVEHTQRMANASVDRASST
jgi:GNAT superfamily N-acetyltransferase